MQRFPHLRPLLFCLLVASSVPVYAQSPEQPNAGVVRRAHVGLIGSPGGMLGDDLPTTGFSAGGSLAREIAKGRSARVDGELMYIPADFEGSGIGVGASAYYILQLPLPPSSPLRPYVGVGASAFLLRVGGGAVFGGGSEAAVAFGGSGLVGWEWDLGRSVAFGEIGLNAYAGEPNSYLPIRFGVRF